MSAAERRARTRWGLAVGALLLAALLLVALGLRLWGLRTGLPYVYNADENAHFVPRAIGMFGHGFNPGYFINPPAFTYLLHVAFAVGWGGEGVQRAYAADPGDVFTVARAGSALLGTLAVGLLYAAGARLFGDRRIGLLAAALLAVCFLPVYYGHFALNDVPALAPLCLALVGVAGVLRRGRWVDHAVAGAGLGLVCATKYTGGIVLLCLLAAAYGRPLGARLARVALAGAVALVAFLLANPYALLDFGAFREGLDAQSTASRDGGGKLGLVGESGVHYYLDALTWGFGWLPLAAALAGAAVLARRDRRLAWVLIPAVAVFLVFMGIQDRYFARWLLPVFPLLCLLAAAGALALADWVAARRRLAPAAAGFAAFLAGLALCAQGLATVVHNDAVLAREDTRQLVRDWMVANVPAGTKVVVEPVFPDQWASDPGRPSPATGNGARWNKWPTSRFRGRVVKLEDYERTTRPELVDSYVRGGYCWVVTGSTQYGRAFAEPREVPAAIRYYAELRRRGEVVFRASPYDDGAEPVPFSFDDSFNARPFAYARPGPEIVVYRLKGCSS
ncbi:MAG TPA: glycosyltransferase family 39 protein [Solirubrobacteraceae bacterium]